MIDVYRLKSNISKDHLANRIKYNPHTIELHLVEEDLKDINNIRDTVIYLRSLGIHVVLHHPWTMGGSVIDINTEGYRRDLYFYQLGLMSMLSDELDVKVVFHGNYICEDFVVDKYLSDETFKRIENISKHVSKNILWENAMWSSFSFTNELLIEDIIKPLNLPLCFDVSHAFIDFKGDNQKLLNTIISLEDHIEHYHVVDSSGLIHDGLSLGKGKIDWVSLKPYIEKKSYIFEISLSDYGRCDEMIESANYFNNL